MHGVRIINSSHGEINACVCISSRLSWCPQVTQRTRETIQTSMFRSMTMRRLCTTLQMHSCTAIMLSFSTCQLQRRHSGKAREEMVASTRNLLVRTSSLHGCGQEENSEIRSTRNGPKKQKTGWVARAVQQGHSRPHLAVLDDRVELRGKHRLAVVFPVGHNQPVAISCTSCTTRLMSKSRTQQGRLGFGVGFRLGFMVYGLWFWV